MGEEAIVAGASKFIAFVLTVPNMLVMAGAIWGIQLLKGMWPKLFNNAAAARFLPLFSTVLCMVGVWAQESHRAAPVGDTILLGFVLGAFCGKIHKIMKQTVLGHDNRIVKRPKKEGLK